MKSEITSDAFIDEKVIAVTGDFSDREKSSAATPRLHRVGTLSYTTRGLVVLFGWMLWGDFCFTLMETVVPSILPLKLKSLGVSNLTMALILTTLPGILNLTICPWVSFWSDRYRSKWGRRIPFILWTAPFLTAFLILLGYAESIGKWFQVAILSNWMQASSQAVIVVVIGIFVVCFSFFNMFVGSVYWYLFNDVVPEEYLGRFFGLFRMMGCIAAALYNYFVFPYAETHMKEIFLLAALLYFFGFGLMCLKVKEGRYPPPPENCDGETGLWASIKTFCYECYSLKYYWKFFGYSTCSAVSYGCIATFMVFFYKDIGLDLSQIGKVAAYATFIGGVLAYPSGILCDRYHPLRLTLMVAIINSLLPFNLIYLFYNFSSETVYTLNLTISLVTLPLGLVSSAAYMPMYMRVLPKERYGQFSSADALVRALGVILGGLLAGGLIDVLKGVYHGDNFCYRYIPLWSWVFQILATTSLLLFYREWKRYGGSENYSAPMPQRTVE
jgi:MFS family permease